MSSVYHPQTDGQTEVVNRCLEQYLRCFTSQHPKSWESFLSWKEYWYNTSFHISIGTTPFQALYGRAPPGLINYLVGTSPVSEVDHTLQNRDELLRELKNHLVHSNNRMKQYADAKRREMKYTVGDWVYLKLQPYRQQSVFRRAHQKLANKYFRPFQVTAAVGPVAYRLALPMESKVHNVFHVSLLKKKFGNDTSISPTLPPFSKDTGPIIEPLQILDYRWVKRGTKFVTEALVQWKHLALEDATWEDPDQLQQQFSSIHLADKAVRPGRANDSTPRRTARTPHPNPRYMALHEELPVSAGIPSESG
jgi:hypothetical protein